jgi:hypothetical protein
LAGHFDVEHLSSSLILYLVSSKLQMPAEHTVAVLVLVDRFVANA